MMHCLYHIARRSILSVLFICCLGFTARAQEYSYARYDVKDGLAGSVVYCGVEDKDGFLWFGTETGLSRFDGTHFRNFTTADGLPDNEILRLFVDSKNRVWIRPFRNAICYYWKGKIYNQQNDSLLRKLSIISEIVDITEDSRGNILIAETRGTHIITPGKKIITVRDPKDRWAIVKAGVRDNGCFGLIANRWPRSGLATVLTVQPETYEVKEQPTSFSAGFLHFSWLSPGLETYSKDDSLYFLWSAGKRQSKYPVLNVISISPLNDSLCAINTVDGSKIFNFRKGEVVRYCMRGKIVNAVLLDSEGSYWFMTAGAGICRIGSFEFVNFTFTAENKDALSVFSIQQADSQLYVGTERSILWKIDTGTFKTAYQYLFAKATHARILSMTAFPGKGMILGTDYGMVGISEAGIRRSDIKNSSVKSTAIYKDKFVLAATNNGVHLVNDRFLLNNIVWHGRSTACFAVDDTIYVGTLTGLYVVDSTSYGKFLGNRFPLFKSRIAAINASADGTLWVATNGNGLIGFKGNRITHTIRQENGLTSDICRTLYVSGSDVWVGTDKGLNRVNVSPGNYRITTYTSDDGLNGNIINTIYVEGTRVYAGTPAGLTSFDANKISLNSYCKLRITNIYTPDKAWAPDTANFVLPAANNAIRMEYVGISYRAAGDITYRYRLTGLNDTWQTTRETFLSYPSLPSGNYELQLIATNKFGVESEMVRIPFQVEKLLWEKTWFRILALIIAWVLIWIFVNARIKRVRRQNDEKMQINNRMAELEQMALKAQMNPHFIFNSLNSLQQYVIDKDILGANKFITEFSRLIRLTLDISSKTRISIYEEISYITTYLELEKTKFEDAFSYSVTVAPEVDPLTWYIPPMILQPYVENSIRHGVRYRNDKQGHITVSVKLNEQYLICQVEDNGVGRKQASQYKSQIPIEYQSKGMTLTAKRIEMLNTHHATPVLIDIEDLVINNIPAGTRVIVRFPLQDAGRSS